MILTNKKKFQPRNVFFSDKSITWVDPLDTRGAAASIFKKTQTKRSMFIEGIDII